MAAKFKNDPERPDCKQCGRPMASRGGKADSGKKRYRCTPCKVSTTATKSNDHRDAGIPEDLAAENASRIRKAIKGGQKRFIVTCAANNTTVHGPFFRALEVAADHMGAELIVIPVSYKNISLYTGGQEFRKWWDKRLDPYIIETEIALGGGIVVDGDTKIQATAADPLSGLHDIGGPRWRVFGHPQIAMEPVAMPGDRMPKRTYTTGACTKKSYSRTKAGKKAEFHHVYGALIVEVEGRNAFVRNVNYDPMFGGGFFDLDCFYSEDGVSEGEAIKVLATGDEHVKFFDKKVRRATYDAEDSIAKTLRPEWIVRQDVFDAYAISHHHERSPLKQYAKHVGADNCARVELDQVVDFINDTTPEGARNAIVAANHHDHLDKWLDRASANHDHVNAHLILELQAEQRKAIDEGREPYALRLYLEPRLLVPTEFLDRNTPFIPGKGADYSQHGDVGVNGSRGSARGLAKSALKMTIGHSHGARIVKGVYQVGKSPGRLEYENGLSDHTNTHSIEYANGKRTLIDIINGKWRGGER